MLRQITFRSGPPGLAPLSVPGKPVTIFVGPNNAGKSLALREIRLLCTSPPGKSDWPSKVIANLQIEPVTFDDFAGVFRQWSVNSRWDPSKRIEVRLPPKHGGQASGSLGIDIENARKVLSRKPFSSGDPDWPYLVQYHLAFLTVSLDGRTRFDLVEEQDAGDLMKPAETILGAVFRDDERRRTISDMVLEAFGLHLLVDPTALPNLRVRLSEEAPPPMLEQSVSSAAREFYSRAPLIQEYSDGIQAFVGLLVGAFHSAFKIVLVDEPEAFLHPPLVRLLGRNLARVTRNSGASLIAATHSADFVMGCIQSGVPVQVIRLTYDRGSSTSQMLPASELNALMRQPMLRSAGMLAGLFHRGVVVTEGDADRCFYTEVNERVVQDKSGGALDALFVNAQNKQTEWAIVKPMRVIGIPTAAVVDADIVADKGDEWTRMLDGANVPESIRDACRSLRDKALLKKGAGPAEKVEREALKRDGRTALDPEGQVAFDKLLAILSEYGIFVVPGGELESWLRALGVSCPKSDWLEKMLVAMGGDPGDPAYVKPSGDDVWAFMRAIGAWLADANRKGM